MIGLAVILAIGVGALLYFLPSFIAMLRKTPNALPLFLVNLFLGWSGLAWLACLIWSIVETPSGQRRYYDESAMRYDPYRPIAPPELPGRVNSVPEWFFANGSATSGPHSSAEMEQFARSGVFRHDTLCWKPAFGDKWQPYGQLRLAGPGRGGA